VQIKIYVFSKLKVQTPRYNKAHFMLSKKDCPSAAIFEQEEELSPQKI